MEKRDIPIGTINEDQFNLLPYVRGLSSFIRSAQKPITISIQGEWGSGKTSFMNMLEDELCNNASKQYDGIWINTWEFFLEDDYEIAVNKLVSTIIREIESKFKNVKCSKSKDEILMDFKNFSKKFSKAILGITGRLADGGESFLDDLLGPSTTLSLRDIKVKFENFISEIIEQSEGMASEAFLIFVDDLDRVHPRLAVTLLEALKILFDIKYCIFVIAIDYEVVAKGVEEKYGIFGGSDRDICKSYFDKLIQLPFVIPTSKFKISDMVMERLYEMKFMNTEYDYRKYRNDIINIVSLTTNNNPRTIKRLLNMLHLTVIMDREQIDNSSAHYQLLELILVAMQLAYPKIYQLMQTNEDFTSWKKSALISSKDKAIDVHLKEALDIDCEWKEVVYLVTASDPLLKMHYNKISILLELFRNLESSCNESAEYISEIFGVISMTDINVNSSLPLLYNGQAYEKSSQTQFKQGNHLIEELNLKNYTNVLDVGCGNGKTTFELLNKNPNLIIDAFDISETQIEVAKQSCMKNGYMDNINFYVMDALELKQNEKYDLVFSNATLHWITNSKRMYTLLYDALKHGGRLAVHQGGSGCYSGLHHIVKQAYTNLGFGKYFKNWTFPVFYPTKEEMERVLIDIGFKNIYIESQITDGKEFDHLIENFEKASLIFYKQKLSNEEEYKELIEEYYRLCSLEENIDTTTHRLYILGDK